MSQDFADILNKCIERVLRGETVEQCVKDYPQQAGELKPLLELALTVHKSALVEPRPEFKARLRYQLHTSPRAPEQKRKGFLLGWQHRWATVVIVFLLFFLLGGGTVAASTNSLPDQPLYPVKLAAEQVQLTFTFSAVSKAKLLAKFVDRRVKEIVLMAERGKPEKVQRLASRLTSHLEKIGQLIGAEPTAPLGIQERSDRSEQVRELRRLIQENAARHRAMLQEAERKTLPPVRPDTVAEALRTSQTRYERALQAMGMEPLENQP